MYQTNTNNSNSGNINLGDFGDFPSLQRMSVFEPYPMRDTVQHFCERHLAKIKSYMTSLMVKLPLPVKCTIEERKGRKHAKLHFACQVGDCRIDRPRSVKDISRSLYQVVTSSLFS